MKLLVVTLFVVMISTCIAEKNIFFPYADIINQSAINSTFDLDNNTFYASDIEGVMQIGKNNYTGVFEQIMFYPGESGEMVAEGVFALKNILNNGVDKPSFSVCGTTISSGYALAMDDGKKVFFCGCINSNSGGDVI